VIRTDENNETCQYKPRGIFREKPCVTADNYFGNDLVDTWMGEKGFGFLHTTRRDCLPPGVPDWAWHKESVTATDQRTRVARFLQPITAVRKEDQYTRAFCSFQSTGPTNLSAVNALNGNSLFARSKCRGTGDEKRSWVIEMNDARQLYLASYGRIDTIDYYIKQCQIFYVTWKYWHAAKNHALGLALITAYDMYAELFEPAAKDFFGIENNNKQKKLSFHQFRDRLSKKGLTYDPGFLEYKGDELMRQVTRLAKKRREAGEKEASPQSKKKRLLQDDKNRKKGRPKKDDTTQEGLVTTEQFKNAIKHRDLKKRFCGSLTEYIRHEESIKYLDNKVHKKGKVCYWCGAATWAYCGICKDPITQQPLMLHHCPRTGKAKGKCCFSHAHNEEGFGLAKKDQEYIGEKQKDWVMPTKKQVREHAKHIKELRTEFETNDL
jgi:hypothetical protein